MVVQAVSHSARATEYNTGRRVGFCPCPVLVDWPQIFCFAISTLLARHCPSTLLRMRPPRQNCLPRGLLGGDCPTEGQWRFYQFSVIIKGQEKPRLTGACSRLALRAEFQSYFRVVIVFRGARVMRRNRQAADARRWARCCTRSCRWLE